MPVPAMPMLKRLRRVTRWLAAACLATLLAACGDAGLHGPLPSNPIPDDLYVPMFFGEENGAEGIFTLGGKLSTSDDGPQMFTVTSAGAFISVMSKRPEEALNLMVFRLVDRISPTEYLVHFAEGISNNSGTGCVTDFAPRITRTCVSVDKDGKPSVTTEDSLANYTMLDLLPNGGVRFSTLVDARQSALAGLLLDSGIALKVGADKQVTQTMLMPETTARIHAALKAAVAADREATDKSTVTLEFQPAGPDGPLEAAANSAAWAGQYDRAVALARNFSGSGDAGHAATLAAISANGLTTSRDCGFELAQRQLAQPLAARLDAAIRASKAGAAGYGSFQAVPGIVSGARSAPCTGGSVATQTAAAPLQAAAAAAPVEVPVRRALLIGMSGYSDPKLLVPGDRTKADAIAVADVLRGIKGYVEPTIMAPDADNARFDDTFSEFVKSVRQGDQVLLFYSGHGIEYRGDNYLLLRDAQAVMPKDDFSIKRLLDRTATSLRDMIKAIKARGPSNIIVVLNACRNITDPNLGTGDGDFDFNPPARLSSEPGVGTIFATTSDTFAEVCLGDCDTDKSPYTVFTRRFLEKLQTPNLTVTNLVYEVGAAVEQDVATHGRVQRIDWHDQTDFNLKGQVYIGPVQKVVIDVIPQPQPQPQPQPTPTPAPNSAEAARALESCRLAAAPPLLFERIETGAAIASCRTAVAMNAGSPDVESWLGRAYDAATDYAGAAQHYRVAADGGVALAQHNLANLYRKGQGIAVDASEAFRLYKLAAEQEFPQSFASLAEFYEKGEVVGQNLPEARRLYQLAADRGIARGVDGVGRVDALLAAGSAATQCAELAAPFRDGRGVPIADIDVASAEPSCREALAASPGNPELQFYLGRVLNAAGRGTDAVAMFQQAADSGNAAAQNMLGRMYAIGIGVAKDDAKAFALYEMSAAQGDTAGIVNLAESYISGSGVLADPAKGATLLAQAVDAGDDDAPMRLGNLYLSGKGVKQDYAEARRLYEKARGNGVVAAAVGLGLIYQFGYGVPIDYAAALTQYGDAANNGNAAGNYRLGEMHEKGLGVPVSLSEARKYYTRAADKGDTDAKAALERLGKVSDARESAIGLCRSLVEPRIGGKGVDVGSIDLVAGDAACKAALAALPDDPEAQFLAGRVAGLAGRSTEAASLFTRSSDQGYAPAQNSLGALYVNGVGVTRNADTARELYLKSAGQGYALALTNLGFLYALGTGVPKDDAQALRYFTDAAKAGSSQADLELGNIHLVGRGVPVDYVEAARRYRLAWDDGLSPGAVGLGILYEGGYGVTADLARAMGYYEAASKAGNPEGTYYIGRLYENGRGVTKDLARARTLYQQAADGGNVAAKDALARLAKSSDAGDVLLERCRAAAEPRLSGHGVHFDGIDTAIAEPACRASLAADANSPERQFLLARVLDRTEKYDEAAPLYSSAAAQLYAPAQSGLGILHLYGRGVRADHARARELFDLSAAQGDAIGISNLGLANELGYGGAIDLVAAHDLYELAIEAGLAVANLHLGSMYFEGRGVAKDMEKSARLMDVALADGVTVETAAWGTH